MLRELLLHAVGNGEAVRERVVALAERHMEAKEDTREAVKTLVGVVVELLRRVVPENVGMGGAFGESTTNY